MMQTKNKVLIVVLSTMTLLLIVLYCLPIGGDDVEAARVRIYSEVRLPNSHPKLLQEPVVEFTTPDDISVQPSEGEKSGNVTSNHSSVFTAGPNENYARNSYGNINEVTFSRVASRSGVQTSNVRYSASSTLKFQSATYHRLKKAQRGGVLSEESDDEALSGSLAAEGRSSVRQKATGGLTPPPGTPVGDPEWMMIALFVAIYVAVKKKLFR